MAVAKYRRGDRVQSVKFPDLHGTVVGVFAATVFVKWDGTPYGECEEALDEVKPSWRPIPGGDR